MKIPFLSRKTDEGKPAYDHVPFWGILSFVAAVMIFALKSGSVVIGVMFASAVLASLFMKKRVRLSRLAEIGAILGIVLVLFLVQGTQAAVTSLNVTPGTHVPIYYFTLLLLASIVVKTYKTKSLHDLHMMFLFGLTSVAIGSFQSAPASEGIITALFSLYAFASIFYFHDLALLVYPKVETSASFTWHKAIPLLVSLPVVLLLSLSFGSFMKAKEPDAVSVLAEGMSNLPSFSFGNTTKLGTMESIYQSKKVVIRIFKKPDGADRVRGKIYNQYLKGQWSIRLPKTKMQPLKNADVPDICRRGFQPRFPAEESFPVFSLNPRYSYKDFSSDRLTTEKYFVSLKANNLIYRPAGALYAAGDFATLETDAAGNFEGNPRAMEYEVCAAKTGPLETLDTKNPPDAADLAMPEECREAFRTKALEMCGTKTGDLERAYAVEQYLQQNYTYQHGIKLTKRKMDPVLEFITYKNAAHCEYFASGMVLMLRSLGIPSRYVVGFAVTEYNRPGGCYLVREKEAHAWVQVYIKGRGWVEFDPTPPSWQPDRAFTETGNLGDYLSMKLRMLYEYLKAGNWKKAFGELASMFREAATGRLYLVIGIPVLAILAFAAWRMSLARRLLLLLKREKIPAPQADPGSLEMRLLLSRLDVYLRRRHIPRPHNLTLLEFADILQAEKKDDPKFESEKLAEVRKFLQDYTGIRYGGAEITGDDVSRLKESLEKIMGR